MTSKTVKYLNIQVNGHLHAADQNWRPPPTHSSFCSTRAREDTHLGSETQCKTSEEKPAANRNQSRVMPYCTTSECNPGAGSRISIRKAAQILAQEFATMSEIHLPKTKIVAHRLSCLARDSPNNNKNHNKIELTTIILVWPSKKKSMLCSNMILDRISTLLDSNNNLSSQTLAKWHSATMWIAHLSSIKTTVDRVDSKTMIWRQQMTVIIS